MAGRKSGSGRDDNRRESRESFTHGQDDVGKNGVGVLVLLDQGFVRLGRMQSSGDIDTLSTWWLIPLSKWVKTPAIYLFETNIMCVSCVQGHLCIERHIRYSQQGT